MSPACASLASLCSYAILGGLTVHALAWPQLELGDQNCGCILPIDDQLKRMAEILEKEQFSGIKSLNLRFEDESMLDLAGGIFTEFARKGVLQLSRADRHDEQVNTFHSLRPFMKYIYE